MAEYRAGDLVHVAGFGKGLVREVRNHGRYLVEVKGRAMEIAASQLSSMSGSGHDVRKGRPIPTASPSTHDAAGPVATLDLHGHTADEALDLLERTLSDALLAGARELRVIHGRSGGRIKVAVHRRLAQLPSVQSFRVDPSNAGVTIVVL